MNFVKNGSIASDTMHIKSSISSRVARMVTLLIAAMVVTLIAAVSFLMHRHVSAQTHALLAQEALSMQKHFEQRIGYLVDSATLLTKNELVVNALVDVKGRNTYLPQIIENFIEGKDVKALGVVDFDSKILFNHNTVMKRIKQSPSMRMALLGGALAMYIDPISNELVVIAPIEYYSTTQGAMIIVFDLHAIAKRYIKHSIDNELKLFVHERELFSTYNDALVYESYKVLPLPQTPNLETLNLGVQVGIAHDAYVKPINDAIVRLVLIGVVFVILGVLFAMMLGYSITRPIVTLYSRVKQSSQDNTTQCSPLGSNDELDALARAFDERTLMLQYQAEHDALTALPNRVLLYDRLNQSISQAKEHNKKVAVLFVDLDRFKEINDSFGHGFGDSLLQYIGKLLQGLIRSQDTVARIGGDEYIILMPGLVDEDIVTQTIGRVLDMLAKPIVIQSRQLYITCSIGVALFPDNGKNESDLMQNADAAMYKAKASGRNTYAYYTANMTQRAIQRITMETEIRTALKRNEFEVYFQPQMDMRSDTIIGFEALIRWNHPQKGMISPGLFIPLAEETALIIEIDRWMMLEAMTRFVAWEKMYQTKSMLSVNLSLIQFQRVDFYDVLVGLIEQTGMNPKQLQLEVTESQIMVNPKSTIDILYRIKSLGVELAIDDFGTGHSSLAYLKSLPVNKLKIDQAFVHDIENDQNNAQLTKAIVAMAKSLHLEVIAEGVETQKQKSFLLEIGCHEAQGYLYHRPKSSEDIDILLGQIYKKI